MIVGTKIVFICYSLLLLPLFSLPTSVISAKSLPLA